MNRFFKFLKDTVHFCKILIIFCLILHLLYWIERLISTNWFIINLIAPYLDIVRDFAGIFNNGKITLFDVVIEIKDIIAVFVYATVYVICRYTLKFVIKLEDITDDGYRYLKKVKQNNLNNELQQQQFDEQKIINKYQIYIETSLKKRFVHGELNINKNEEDKCMIKFIAEKMNIMPNQNGDGYLYSDCNFNTIDKFLDVLTELINSPSKLNYTICVHTYRDNSDKGNISKLINLRQINKIIGLSDTVWKYNYKIDKRYKTSHIGIFQGQKDSFEVFQFIKK